MRSKDFLTILDVGDGDVESLVKKASTIKNGATPLALSGKTAVLLFEKPSLRTRVSFEVAIQRLGGSSIYLGPQEVGLGTRESISDITKVLSRYVDAIICRTFAHANLEEMVSNTELNLYPNPTSGNLFFDNTMN